MSVEFAMDKASPRDAYRVLSSVVVPRPIAWVLTRGPEKVLNIAPFSSFMGTANPPLVTLAIGNRRDGSPKDTYKNIRDRKEAVVHIIDVPLLNAMHASAEDVPPDVSEVESLGLKTVESTRVKIPRLIDAPAAFECRFREEHPMKGGSTFVMLDILHAHISEAIWDDDAECALANKWSPVGRLGSVKGPNYATLGTLLTLGKSKLPEP